MGKLSSGKESWNYIFFEIEEDEEIQLSHNKKDIAEEREKIHQVCFSCPIPEDCKPQSVRCPLYQKKK